MHTPALRLLVAALALLVTVGACAGDSGAQWTYAPVADATPESPDASTAPPASAAPSESGHPAESGAPTESATPSGSMPPHPDGGPRVIRITADGTLQFTQDGQKVTDIPVTPGETVVFQIENTAGFDHDFYIGTDEQLAVAGGTTDVGIPAWTSGVKELEWVVPDDITGLKFGCTIPGHYTLMQGTFSLRAPAQPDAPAPESAAPAGTAAPAGSAAPAESMGPHESMPPHPDGGAPRVIEVEATAALQFNQDGQKVTDIPVTPGETVVFRVENTAGFEHDFYIGTDEQLAMAGGTTEVGIPAWTSGVKELEWVVPDDIAGLKFGCTIPGHYTLMQGIFSVSA